MRQILRKSWLWCLVVLIVGLAMLLRPVPFDGLSDMEQTDSVLVTCFTGDDTEQVRLSQEQIQPLAELLEDGTLRLVGRETNLSWNADAGENLYNLYPDSGEPFSLRSDGRVYKSLPLGNWSLGSAEYCLENCDMTAVDAELKQLLGMA